MRRRWRRWRRWRRLTCDLLHISLDINLQGLSLKKGVAQACISCLRQVYEEFHVSMHSPGKRNL